MIINVLHEIFTDIESAKLFLIEHDIIQTNRNCPKCGSISKLQIDGRYEVHLIQWRCTLQTCRKRFRLSSSKLPILKVLHCIYLLMADTSYHNMFVFHGISDATIASIKSKLLVIYERYIHQRPVLLGGPGVTIEVDETVLSRKGIIRNPTSTDDARAYTVWILGAVCKTNTKKFVLKRVENRQITTLSNALEGIILVGSNLVSDGYPTYPGVALNLYLNHNVVNHTLGFVAPDGSHSNSIEGFWSHLKSTMRKEHGVMRENIDNWLIQYTFKRRYLLGCTREEFSEKYIEILKMWFN